VPLYLKIAIIGVHPKPRNNDANSDDRNKDGEGQGHEQGVKDENRDSDVLVTWTHTNPVLGNHWRVLAVMDVL